MKKPASRTTETPKTPVSPASPAAKAPPRGAATLARARSRSALLVRPGFLIRRLHQIHVALFMEETQAFNITPVQYSLMTALSEHGELDQVGMASEIGLERSGIAEVIPRLEARGLIARRKSETDGRVTLHKLTPKGRTLVQRMEESVVRAHERTIEQLPARQRDALLLMLIQLVERQPPASLAPFRPR